MSYWRILINPKKWDFNGFKKQFNSASEPGSDRIIQSKGGAIMKVCPVKGDTIVYVIKGHIVMKGVVESDGFIQGVKHQQDPLNLLDNQPHVRVEEVAWIKITEICEMPEAIKKTGQRTWLKMAQ